MNIKKYQEISRNMSIPLIVIPSPKDNILYNILHRKRINPIKCDSSTWFSTIYDIWDIEKINIDLLNRIKKLDDSTSISDIKNNICHIKEGICVFRNKLLKSYGNKITNNMIKNLEMLLSVSQLAQINKCYFEDEKVINNPKTKKKDFENIIRMFRKTFSDYDSNIIDLTCKNLEIIFSFKK